MRGDLRARLRAANVQLLQAKLGTDLRVFLLCFQQVVACSAVVGNPLALSAGMRAIAASETARKIVLSEVIGRHTPSYLHHILKIHLADASFSNCRIASLCANTS